MQVLSSIYLSGSVFLTVHASIVYFNM